MSAIMGTLHCSARTSIGIKAGAQSVSSDISFLVKKLELIRQHIRLMERTLVRLVDETEANRDQRHSPCFGSSLNSH
jgi:hypothetical protein